MDEPPRYPWQEAPKPQRYLGMSAAMFDAVVLGVIACIAAGVWVFIFGAWTPDRADSLDPRGAIGLRDESPELAAVFMHGDEDLKEVFSASAGSFSEDVSSFRGEAEIAMSVNGNSVSVEMEYAFEAPGRMYMKMDMPFGRSELLMDLPAVYIRPQGEEWYLMTGEALGINPEAFQRLLEQRGVVDYSGQAGMLDGLVQLRDQEIDGESYFHYSGELDITEAVNDLPKGLLDPSMLDQVARASGPIRAEAWLDKATALPRRMTINMDLAIEDIRMSMDMRMDFLDYNRPVNIPEAPADARPVTELNVARIEGVFAA